MPITASTTYFVSDIHWQPTDASGLPALGLFGEFLRELGEHARAVGGVHLYVLGDLFEYWFERRGRAFAFYEPHLVALTRARDAGIHFTLLFGNRDFTYGRVLEERADASIAGDRTTLTLGTQRLLLEHGDLLCTRDWRYQLFRRLIRSRFTRAVASLLTMTQLTRLIAWLRRASTAEVQRKRPTALEVVDTVVAKRINSGFDVVLCGHVHRPSRRPVTGRNHMGELITLGSWEPEAGWYVCWNNDALELTRYTH
jgi:UDP-2,3-diacylglucosamine hydrolase